MKKRKSGLSTIVATLIVILLVLVAVAIVWAVLRNVIQDSTEQVNLGKFTLDLDLKQVQIIDTDTISVTVKRNPGQGEFVSLNFIIEDGDNSEVVKVNTSMEELEQRVITFDLQDINSGNITKISIAPVFRLESGKEIIGDIKDTLELSGSSSSSSSECTSPSECDDSDACTTDTCPSGTCIHTTITTCIDSDGCCPSGCTILNDDDCSIFCGDGSCNGAETCGDTDNDPECNSDCGSCPASCGDSTCDTGECNTCPQDCTHAECCSDGTCNNGETCGDTDTDPECNSDCGACSTTNPPAYSNLVTWLRFEGDVTDEQGNNDATMAGTIPYVSGYAGQSLDFPGSAGNYVNIPITIDYDTLSIAFWANPDDISTIRGFFNYNYNSGYRGRLYGGGLVQLLVLGTTYPGSGANPVGEWRHYVFTFDEASGELKVYINSVINIDRTASGFNLDATYMHVGKSWTTSEMFDGKIDEFMIYNKVLNQTEVSELYAYIP